MASDGTFSHTNVTIYSMGDQHSPSQDIAQENTPLSHLSSASDGGMTNYPTGPNRTPLDQIGPHRTRSDHCAINICQCCFAIVKVLLKKVTYLITPLANPRTVTHSLTHVHLANTFDNRCTRTVYIVSSYEQKRPALSALNYRVNCRRSALSRLNRVQLTLPSMQPRCWQYICNEFWHICFLMS